MQSIRSKNTSIERAVRTYLHAQGFRFRLHRKDLPGKPDIVLPKYKSVVFVHGCFWHQHAGCKDGRLPRINTDYWQPKLAKTVERDQRHQESLRNLGWRVFVVWDCELDASQLKALTKEIRGLDP